MDETPNSDRRKIATVIAADVAGFGRLMQFDEVATVAGMEHLRSSLIVKIQNRGGRIINFAGDAWVAYFDDPVSAVQAGIDIQLESHDENKSVDPKRRLEFRMGIHSGPVFITDKDVLGETVNLAARLQTLADPGGIVVSRKLFESVKSLALKAQDLGAQRLKNITEPLSALRLELGLSPAVHFSEHATEAGRQGPRIAVLPFDLFQEAGSDHRYLADGLAEDLITALSHFRDIFVIARNSSFTYRDRSVDVRQVGQELGVHYVVEGSLRIWANNIRLTIQLVEGATGSHIWADHVDISYSELFAIQDEIVAKIVGLIAPRVKRAEIAASLRKHPRNLDAYDLFLRALPYREAMSAEACAEAYNLLNKSIALNPHFAPALAHAAMCLSAMRDQGWAVLHDKERILALELARRAVETDIEDAGALALSGQVYAALGGDIDGGLSLIDRALQINPNLADAWARSSMVRVYAGELGLAMVHADRSIALDPLDPGIFLPLCAKGYASLFSDDCERAASFARLALQGKQRPAMAYRILVAALANKGPNAELRRAVQALLDQHPHFSISVWRGQTPFTLPDQTTRLVEAFRLAGLPE